MEFKIGLLNAWLPILFFNIWMIAIARIINSKGLKRSGDTSWYEKKEETLMPLIYVFWFSQIIYGIWAPLKIGTVWFNIGAVITILGFILHTIANHNYMTAPLDKVITKGLYKISRNPLYFFSDIIMIGISIAAASWIMLVIITGHWAIHHRLIIAEERYCLKTYGEEYREYMKKTPRYFLF